MYGSCNSLYGAYQNGTFNLLAIFEKEAILVINILNDELISCSQKCLHIEDCVFVGLTLLL